MEIVLDDVALVSLNVIDATQESAIILEMVNKWSLTRNMINWRVDATGPILSSF